MVMGDGSATKFKLVSVFVHLDSTFCTNIFKHDRYCNRSNAFIQHGRFDLLLVISHVL